MEASASPFPAPLSPIFLSVPLPRPSCPYPSTVVNHEESCPLVLPSPFLLRVSKSRDSLLLPPAPGTLFVVVLNPCPDPTAFTLVAGWESTGAEAGGSRCLATAMMLMVG